MMFHLGFGKKHVILAVGLIAVVAGAFLYRYRADIARNGVRVAAPTTIKAALAPVTYDDYKTAAAKAVKDFSVGDRASADTVLGRLTVLRVPREGMAVHQELTIDVAAYREALNKNDDRRSVLALERLRSCAQANPWLGLSI